MNIQLREDTIECLNRYNIPVDAFHYEKALAGLDAAVDMNERILYIAPANCDVTPRNTAKPETYIGAIAFTDKSIYVYQKGFGLLEGLQKFDVRDLERVGYHDINFELTLRDATIAFFTKVGQRKDLNDMLNWLIGQHSQQPDSVPSKKIGNVTEQMRDLKSMLDEGLITQEDFNAKKKQLLGL